MKKILLILFLFLTLIFLFSHKSQAKKNCDPDCPGGGGGGGGSAAVPIGAHDGSNCTGSSGWTCDANDFSKPLTVHFYANGPAGTGTFIGSTTANQTRETAVANLCGGVAAHGFTFNTPDSVKDNAAHNIYAYAINYPDGSGANPLLSGSPKSITCAPAPTVTPGGPTVTPEPTANPTPDPGSTGIPITPGTEDLCTSLTLSDTNLSSGETLTATAKANTTNINNFAYEFYNLDNLDTTNNPKPIKFVTGKDFGYIKTVTVTTDTNTQTVDFIDMNRPDLNWNNFKPKRIRVDAYFSKTGTNTWSKYDAACSKNFNAATIDPTPTINPNCTCNTSNACTTACVFNKFASGVTYASPIKCSLSGVFSSTPTAANKTQWCRNYLVTRGDADGDGNVDLTDYFYYVSVANGDKVPPTVNVDFDGDGSVSALDRAIVVKSIKP